MRFGSVCSGVSAASLAWNPLGWNAAWFSDIAAFPSAVLAHRFPLVPNLGDMRQIVEMLERGDIEAPDVFIGGTPCQAFSVAGNRLGLEDERGSLSLEFVRIADAIDKRRAAEGKPACIVVWENVRGVFSDKTNAFGCLLGGLAGSGCELQPAGRRWADAGVVVGPTRTASWRLLDSQFFGVAQQRQRCYLVASARDDFDPGAVLLEFDGVRRDSAPRREEGQDDSGSTGTGLARCITTGEFKRQDWETCNLVADARGVRRLTATECERLFGMPDGWTDAPGASDTTRGHALGNSATVCTLGWIGERIEKELLHEVQHLL